MWLFNKPPQKENDVRTEQIELILQLLREARLKNPELRFFQLLYNMEAYHITVDPCDWQVYTIDPYHLTNKKIISTLENYISWKTSSIEHSGY